jgi:hypothetical protein
MVGAAVDRVVDLVHWSTMDQGQGVMPRSNMGRPLWIGRLVSTTCDEAVAARRREAARGGDGGGSPELA